MNMFSMSPTKFDNKMRTWNTMLKFLLTSLEMPWLVENWRLVGEVRFNFKALKKCGKLKGRVGNITAS